MSIARYLAKLAQGLSPQGVLGASKGGTGLTSAGTAGNVLISDGTTWVSQPAEFSGGGGGLGSSQVEQIAKEQAIVMSIALG